MAPQNEKMKKKIQGWAKNYYGEKKRRKKVILDQLSLLDEIRDQRELTAIEMGHWIELKHQLEELYLDEELYWQLRSRQMWLKEGDRNTKFFHRMANTKIRKSKIQALEINQELTAKESDIHSHILSYYKDLLGTPGATFAQLGTHFWDDAEKVSVDENISLTAPFSEQEIYQAVFQFEPQGAPGPDGFTFAFYQKFWKLVKFDLILLCHQFWHEQLQLSKINKSIICLIPKEPEAQHIKKFRPISLVNCSFKIISKILTYRLEPILQRLIDAN